MACKRYSENEPFPYPVRHCVGVIEAALQKSAFGDRTYTVGGGHQRGNTVGRRHRVRNGMIRHLADFPRTFCNLTSPSTRGRVRGRYTGPSVTDRRNVTASEVANDLNQHRKILEDRRAIACHHRSGHNRGQLNGLAVARRCLERQPQSRQVVGQCRKRIGGCLSAHDVSSALAGSPMKFATMLAPQGLKCLTL
jgi:hypothetical protein